MSNTMQIKVLLLGETGVGKTCIVQRFVYSTFSGDTKTTLSVMFVSKLHEISPLGTSVKFNIWDTAGQERYRSLAATYYQDAAAAILVYDVTKKTSFDAIAYWIEEVKANGPKGMKVAIAGNKADLIAKQEVDREEAKELADKNNALFKIVSAKEGTGVDELFTELAQAVIKEAQETNANRTKGIKLESAKTTSKSSSYCC